MKPHKKGIIIYDGECWFCNRFIRWIDTNDKQNYFKFIPLHHPIINAMLSHKLKKYVCGDTIVLIQKNGLLTYSTAIIIIISSIKYWQWTKICLIIPKMIRDTCYKIFAKNRYRFKKQCELYISNTQRNINTIKEYKNHLNL